MSQCHNTTSHTHTHIFTYTHSHTHTISHILTLITTTIDAKRRRGERRADEAGDAAVRAAVARVAVRALLSTLRSPPQPPQLLLLSKLMSSPAPCGGVQPRHKHWILVPANHVMVSRRHEEKGHPITPSFRASSAPGLRANGSARHAASK